MTHSEEDAQRIEELASAFLLLSDSGRDCALAILRTLRFAQSAMDAEAEGAAVSGGPPG